MKKKKRKNNPEVIWVLSQYTGLEHATVSPYGACCLQQPSAFSRSWRCWRSHVEHIECFQASEDLLTDRKTRRDLPSMAQGSLTPGSPTTKSQQGFPESDSSTWRRRKGGFLPLNWTVQNSTFECASLQLTVLRRKNWFKEWSSFTCEAQLEVQPPRCSWQRMAQHLA